MDPYGAKWWRFFEQEGAVKGTKNHVYGSRLGPREGQVAALLVKGMHNGEIAALLGTTHNTVKKQVRRVLAKCGASNRTELAGLLATEEFRMVHPGHCE